MQNVKISVTVANTGSRVGKEVIQVYATDDRSSVVTPNQELIAFTKVEIAWVLSYSSLLHPTHVLLKTWCIYDCDAWSGSGEPWFMV